MLKSSKRFVRDVDIVLKDYSLTIYHNDEIAYRKDLFTIVANNIEKFFQLVGNASDTFDGCGYTEKAIYTFSSEDISEEDLEDCFKAVFFTEWN